MIENSITILAIFFGAIVGSFLNVVILRIPASLSIVFPASRCPKCLAGIKWYDNIPILSFLVLRGKCRSCKTRISWQYPLVELLMAVLSYALLQRFFITLPYFIYFIFSAALLAIIFIDFHHQIIPDVISLPGIVLGFVCSFVNPYVTWQSSGVGLLIGGGSLYLLALGYYLVKKVEGMGGGDIKLLAMIGAFLGWQALPFVVFSSSLVGAVFGIGAMIKQKKGGQTVIPYGPFLSLGALVYLFYSELVHQYVYGIILMQ